MAAVTEFDQIVRPIVLVNRVISIWPLETHQHSLIESRIRIVHRVSMFILVGILCVAMTADVIHNWGDMNEVTECALIASAFYLSMLRLVVYTIYKQDLDYAVDTMRADWVKACEEDLIVLREKCLFGFNMAKYFIVTVIIALTAFMLVPILQITLLGIDDRILPFRGYFFQNQTNSPFYECFYVFEIIAGALGGSTISGATSLNLMLVIHGAAKFSVVRNKLKALRSDDINVKDHLVNCVQLHQEAILFADRAENIINILALGQFVISTGLICFAGFQITSMIHDKGRMVKYVAFINSAILELFIFSYSGNQLITEVLSTSFSYFTVLQAVNEE